MKYAWVAVIALGMLMPAVAEAGGRDRSKWGFSINIGYREGGYYSRYPSSYSHTRISYDSHRDYGRYRHRSHDYYRPAPVYYRPAPVVYCPPPVRQVEYVYYEPVRPVYVRETYRSYEPRYSHYDTGASITYRSTYSYRR